VNNALAATAAPEAPASPRGAQGRAQPRILIADGDWLIRLGLRALFQRAAYYEVVGEAPDLAQALSQVVKLAPDLVLLDSNLDGGGIAAAEQIRQAGPARVVLRTGPGCVSDVARLALRAGCSGVIHAQAAERELLDAVRAVLNGGVYLDAGHAKRLAEGETLRDNATPEALRSLSPRELSVFRLIAQGCTNRSASEQLQLSAKTVEKYRAALMAKLRLRNAVDLRLLALELGEAAQPGPAGGGLAQGL
jgi:DNA-binding NarL/FixJ family response regulator